MELSIKEQAQIVGHYPNINTSDADFLHSIHIENLQNDIKSIRRIKEAAVEVRNIINNEDFVAPFYVSNLEKISNLVNLFHNLTILSEDSQTVNTINICGDSLIDLYEMINNSSTLTASSDMLRMKRIEPWGEITNEIFDDVSNEMVRLRKEAYKNLDVLINLETQLLSKYESYLSNPT